MIDPEVQFTVPAPAALADALREALGEAGPKPSGNRVRGWIRAGRVAVDGAVVLDPGRLLAGGETVDLGPAEETPAAAPPPAPVLDGVLHLDRHLLVATWEPAVGAGAGGDAVAARLARVLEEAGTRGLEARPVPAPDGRAGGLVAAALSPAAERFLAAAFASGVASLEVAALLADGRCLAARAASVGAFLAGLPEAARRPAGLFVSGLDLPHPRTGRALAWRADLPPAFLEADPG